MNKPSVKHLIIVCSILLSVLVSITCIVLINDKKFDNFYIKLRHVDTNLNSAFYNQASEDLDRLYLCIYNKKTALIFLKRSYRIAERTGDYSSLSLYCEKLYNRYKSSVEIAAVYAFALRKDGDIAKSFDISEKRLIKSVYSNIYLLNLIESGIPVSDIKFKSGTGNTYSFIFSDKYTGENLSEAADAHFDERYVIDQALLMLKEGKFSDAGTLLSLTEESSAPELKMFFCYDSGNFTDAEKYFKILQSSGQLPTEQILFSGCDILMRNGKYSEASALYKSYLEKNADRYSLPYRNLYSIHRKDVERITWLVKGLELFPESNELLVPYAWEFYLNNNYDDMKAVVSELRKNDNAANAELLKINLMLIGRSPEHIIGNYWNVFNADPESETITRAFGDFLLENHQYEQLELLMNRYLKNNKPEGWVYVYTAAGKALEGKIDEAMMQIEKALNLNADTVTYFNTAVILNLAGRQQEAEVYLKKALLLEDQKENNTEILSKIYYELAETNFNRKKYNEAFHAVRQAIDLNPDNMKSKLLQKKLEEEFND